MARLGRLRAAAILAVGAALTLSGCGSASSTEDCEEAFESAALSVTGVSAAEFTCTESFGDPQQEGTVTLSAGTEEEALGILDDVLQAYASSAGLEDAMLPYVDYASEDGTLDVHASDLGFNGSPSIGVLRDHYGIEP